MAARSATNTAETGHRVSSQEASVAIKAALRIAACWQLSDRDLGVLLGGVSVASLRRWRSALRNGSSPRADINVDTLDRVSYLLGIYKALHMLFPDAAQADAWVHKPNDGLPFGGRSAMGNYGDTLLNTPNSPGTIDTGLGISEIGNVSP